MHFSTARLLPAHHAIVNPSSTAKPHRLSISDLQVSEERIQNKPLSPKVEYEELFKGNAQEKKTERRIFKEGSEIVESSSSHHVALLKEKHMKDTKVSSSHRYVKKEVVIFDQMNDDIVVMDYQPPHRKTPIHNK
ncbi:hypothetical protein QVD17_35734 [Tagetes erecta]|uniref:Uncharacterized protein n=1 Tax=Tagetes erecta TaxID=13708 RepID=A0AAD8JR36_TARER|nr:hypothetical protein QVD17_35734 [Tagetes erecta]